MNLLETLNNELYFKHLTDDEKIRYIYLRLCCIFSFDTRYYYASFFKDYDLLRKILNKKINVKNISDNLVICHTIVNPLKLLIEEFTSREVELYRSVSHSYAYVNFMNNRYKLDLTGMNDLASVKMGLETKGFRIDGFVNPDFSDLDNSLGFELLDDYEYISKLDINLNVPLFLQSMKISNLLDNSRCKYEFSDAKAMTVKLEQLFRVDMTQRNSDTFMDYDYSFHRLTKLGDKYLDLSKIDDEYKLHEISEDKYLTLKSHLRKRGR